LISTWIDLLCPNAEESHHGILSRAVWLVEIIVPSNPTHSCANRGKKP